MAANNVRPFRPPPPRVLTEKETFSSFLSWQSNIQFYLSTNNDFALYLATEWSKASVANHGYEDDAADALNRKTAVQKSLLLDHMLGIVAQYSPSLLRNDIMKKSTSLAWVWKRLRKYYSLQQSEVNFLKLSSIKQEEGERYETLYQRIVAHLEDNLLRVDSGLLHDGEDITANEELSPTSERLAVYLWLVLIDERLPNYISRVYAHDLQKVTLKDLQPQIVDNMDLLLREINTQEEIVNIHYSRSSNSNRSKSKGNFQNRMKSSSKSTKSCVLCKTAGRPHQGHDISTCWYISKMEKLAMVDALKIDVEDEIDEEIDEEYRDVKSVTSDLQDMGVSTTTKATVQRVQCSASPSFYAFYGHHPCRCIIDTGATSSLISSSFLKLAGIDVKPTRHAARQVDRSTIPIQGEIHISLSYGGMSLPIDALVVDTLDSDILIGVPFCKENDVTVHLKHDYISIQDMKIPYGTKSTRPRVLRTESFLLRNESSKVLFPGEFLEIECKRMYECEEEVVIIPRTDSPLNGTWPAPTISRVINNVIRIPNDTLEPIKLSKAQHVAQIREISTQDECVTTTPSSSLPLPRTILKEGSFSTLVTLDPDNQLSSDEKSRFQSLHQDYDSVFDPNFGVYNDYSGAVRAHLNFGTEKPPPFKPKLPFYNTQNLQQLQLEADKLEELGVLARPEDLGITVQHASPSFLVKKPDGGNRFVTAFNSLSPYVRLPPTVSSDCDSVLKKLSRWKYLIKSDLTHAYFQIPLAKGAIPYLATTTPYKGLRVYTRPGMGMPGAAEHLQELLSRIFGDELQVGSLLLNADDMYIGGNTISELLDNWKITLEKLYLNNLKLSAKKTIICPIKTVILGWIWQNGTLSVSSHKLSPLISADPPSTCSSMRSYIGAYKAISRCIPSYSSILSSLEDSIKGMQGKQKIQWSSELLDIFRKSQEALKLPHVLSIPTPEDRLIITTDGSPVNNGLGATLFIDRNGKRLTSEFYSFKLKPHQQKWLPCEVEALAISAAVVHFGPYIRESKNKTQILTDNRPCVLAFQKLQKGKFSASARVSTFLTQLSSYNIVVHHIKGELNTISDYHSRNPNTCTDSSCQICKFVDEMCDSTVRAVTINDILSGNACMPFTNLNAWKSAQHDCNDLRRTYAHLTQGTRPSKKTRHIENLRRYLLKCSINRQGLIIVRKPDPFQKQRDLIVVPAGIVHGLVTALHIYFQHPTPCQMRKIFDRYFYALRSSKVIDEVCAKCDLCNSLKHIPREIFKQSNSKSPTFVGSEFAADVIRRTKQHILVVRETLSSYTSTSIIPDETGDSLRTGLLINTTPIRLPSCTVRVDGASGFLTLKDDHLLNAKGISLDFGRIKNTNKNPVAEKANQELEAELLKVDPTGAPVTPLILNSATDTLNSRIRYQGVSAKEIVFGRDQITGKKLNVDPARIKKNQEESREKNHQFSSTSKADIKKDALKASVKVGDLVFIKDEGTKHSPRERYIIVKITNQDAVLQKMNGSKLMSKRYEVPLTRIFPVIAKLTEPITSTIVEEESSDDGPIPSTPVDDLIATEESEESEIQENSSESDHDDNSVHDSENDSDNDTGDNDSDNDTGTYPARNRREPAWLREDVWER